ncbi:pilus assembly protein PilX [Shewanella sairae]|uniref:Pilus assembly protein PilX n=1 Tax=Shewanella sairae TaxID=190310 RepID=A0ABQ4PE71_9GAMM|nr:pilus assembly PilX N-terminal domain-containing protein [Shewanella sairae]MCL1128656.1 pilus assembly PilX N-terminal domain-containing protein [Shewanella sairae]GIU45843.1 pilus assembly protein PilX [Shewanella sairae]
MGKQKGMVLFFSLIVLIIMTVIGVALAVNSNQSIKMAGAGSERIEAMTAAQGAQDRVIDINEGTTLINLSSQMVTNDVALGVTNTLEPVGSACQRIVKAHGMKIGCNKIDISSTAVFGRNDLGELTVVTGIEQQFRAGN